MTPLRTACLKTSPPTASTCMNVMKTDCLTFECFTTGENVFVIEADGYEAALETFSSMIGRLVSECELPACFTGKRIAYGFVDGDLYIVRIN